MAERIMYVDEAVYTWQRDGIPVIADFSNRSIDALQPEIIVDVVMAKQNTGTTIASAPVVIACGPGFTAGQDCHAVIETQRGHTLGRVIWEGTTLSDTSTPDGDSRRVLRAPQDGVIANHKQIGDHCEPDELIAEINGEPIKSPFKGVVRGLIHSGLTVTRNMKIGDIDPRDDARLCQLISEKALAIGGGVMEALLTRSEVRNRLWA
jgi:xanthine dehydrogenase accessory factor